MSAILTHVTNNYMYFNVIQPVFYSDFYMIKWTL